MCLCITFVVNHPSGNESEFNYVPTQPTMVSASQVTSSFCDVPQHGDSSIDFNWCCA